MEAITKDCTTLDDSEIAEMADISATGEACLEVGLLSKLRDEWVLVTKITAENRLLGFSFSSLERIGGTPSMLISVASFVREPIAKDAMRLLMSDLYRRALLAFPDEDVLVSTKMSSYFGYQAYAGLEEILPVCGHKPTGEERAWARRLAKRFSLEFQMDDRTFHSKGDGSPTAVFDYRPFDHDDEPTDEDDTLKLYKPVFESVDRSNYDCIVSLGWAMAEDLATGALPK